MKGLKFSCMGQGLNMLALRRVASDPTTYQGSEGEVLEGSVVTASRPSNMAALGPLFRDCSMQLGGL